MNLRRRGRPPHPDVLTPAEWRVLALLQRGSTNAEIASELGVGAETVKTHVSNMLAKLDFESRHELAAWSGTQVKGTAIRQRAFAAIGWFSTVPAALRTAGVVVASGLVTVLLVVALSGGRQGAMIPTPTTTATADPAEPGEEVVEHGAFRLIPPGYAGALDSVAQTVPWGPGTSTDDVSELTQSPLYIEVPGIPDDMERAVFDSHDSTSGRIVRQVFQSADGQRQIEVTRRAVVRLPIDVEMPAPNGTLVLDTETVDGEEAVVYRRAANSPVPTPYTLVHVRHGLIETIVVVRGLPEDTAFSVIAPLVQ